MTTNLSSGGQRPAPQTENPIIIELHQAEKDRAGYFRPVAYIKLHESLRTSGLLAALPAEDLKSFLYLLTFVSPNGNPGAAIHQLCAAMRLSGLKVRRRMSRLVTFHWAGVQLVIENQRESGMTVYTPHPKLISQVHISPPGDNPPQIQASSREAVIAHSRKTYTTPRHIVEAQILEEYYKYRSPQDLARLRPPEQPSGQSPGRADSTDTANQPQSQQAELRMRLEELGLSVDQIDQLYDRYGELRIARQVAWLPYRNARNPAGYLLAAVADNYEAPLALRKFADPSKHETDNAGPQKLSVASPTDVPKP